MRLPVALPPVVLFVFGACSAVPSVPPVPQVAGPDPAAVRQVVASAAAQVKRCYRVPRIARAARRVTTVIEVHFGPDGMLDRVPEIVSQAGVVPETRFDAQLLAQAAMTAVQRCAPLSLPPEYHAGGWDAFELTFGFAAIG